MISMGNYDGKKFKLGTHVTSGWMYRVYRDQVAAAYSSLNFFIFLSPIFKHFCPFLSLQFSVTNLYFFSDRAVAGYSQIL